MPRPETVICYICGRECSANSVKFHEKQCAKKWEAERQREEEKAKREEKRERVRPKQRERVRSESSDDGERLKRSGSYSKLLSVKLGDEKVRKSRSVGDLTGSSSGEDTTDKELMHSERPKTVVLRKRNSYDSPSRERPGTVTLSSFKERPRTASVSSASSTSSSSSHHTTPNSSPKRKLPATPATQGASEVLQMKDKNLISTPRKPNFQANLVKCYICGKELTVHSIKIHEVQCMKKWDAQKQKEKKESKDERKFKRRSAPAMSSHTTVERPSTYNVSDKRKMINEPKNGRNTSEKVNGNGSVFSDSSSEGSNGISEGSTETKHGAGKPNWQPCYICGRDFSLKSLPIHEPQCRKKWEAYKTQKEKLEKRKSSPAKFVSSSSNKSGLLPVHSKIGCENCNRLFTPRQLAEHSKLCTANGSTTNVKLRNQQKAEDSTKRNSRVTCYVCGKEFGSGTIISHEPQCLKKHKQQQNIKDGKLKNGAMIPKDKSLVKCDVVTGDDIVKVNPEQLVGKENVLNGTAETQV